MPSPLAALVRTGRPQLMAILNVTPDSFSDGNRYLNPDAAVEHALQLEKDGAHILDIGAESTRPGAAPVAESEEMSRLRPVLERLIPRLQIPISVDTSKFAVMQMALQMGVRIINDVRAMRADERIPELLAGSGAGVILMHSRGEPDRMQQNTVYADLAGEVIAGLREARDRALSAGLEADCVVLDPGIGFGKSPEANWELLRLVPRLKAELGCAVMIGLSRKSFLTRTFGSSPQELSGPTAAAHLAALTGGARFLRVHDIIEARRVVRVFESLQGIQ